MYLGSVNGQGLEVSLEVWSGLSWAPGPWLKLGPGEEVHLGQGQLQGEPQGLLSHPITVHLSDSHFSDFLHTTPPPHVLTRLFRKPKGALGPARGQGDSSPASPLLF